MRALVTGVAGFIGSHLAEALLARGDTVLGIDCLTPYYDPALKRANVPKGVDFVEADLRTADLDELLQGIDVVYHQASQPGVRLSWADGFGDYLGHNVFATQRLLESSVSVGVRRLVYASSSSVYGRAPAFPTSEECVPKPHSPYGVTKLAAEHLCGLYASNWGISTVSLRYFTVYGPRQRPDMAIHRMLEAGLEGRPFPLFGDGSAIRDFTYVTDVVAANLAAADADVVGGEVFNVGGGGEISMADLLVEAGSALGAPIAVERRPAQPGDVERTGANIDLAAGTLQWSPKTTIQAGLAAHAAWLKELRQGPGARPATG